MRKPFGWPHQAILRLAKRTCAVKYDLPHLDLPWPRPVDTLRRSCV
ncbi:MAG: hypothetical protein VYE14_03765 [Verrucomicrobiota bacterium]|nr:hypothetical protein [Verrucomicrobiota bacterium]